MASLINIVRNSACTLILSLSNPDVTRLEFLDAIRSVNPPGRWKILVVDEYSQALLNSVLKQFDILEENVTCTSICHILSSSLVPTIVVIESITNNREPQ